MSDLKEYVLVKDGDVKQMVTTDRSIWSVQRTSPGYEVVPADQLPKSMLEKIRFWEV